jgi:hypothetical protein
MTYCDYEWLSDFTYEGIMSFLQSSTAAAQADRRGLNVADRLLVTGWIDPAQGTATLNPLFVIPDAGEVQERVPGLYAIVLRDAGGAELARYPFTPLPMEGGRQAPASSGGPAGLLGISELVPFVSGTVRVEIVGLTGVLASVTAGAGAPDVTVLSPNGGETLAGDPITVSWHATEPDGDPLHFSVQYSRDGGTSWELVAQGLTDTHVDLEAGMIGSTTNGLFRVWATDGIHTDSDASDQTFTVPNRAPAIAIVAPAGPLTVALSQTVAFEGAAYDPDTGGMSDAQLQWSSSRDGFLGNGLAVSTADLSVGAHAVTFMADDGAGGIVTATVPVMVVADPSELPPAPDQLTAGPSLIAFQPALGIVSAGLSIDNLNELNAIAWNAQATQPWILLESASGTTPQQITVSLQVGVLPAGTHYGAILLTSPSAPAQTVTIPVQAIVEHSLRLPLLTRGVH